MKHSSRQSALARSKHGEVAAWGLDTHLLAHISDLLAGANWQRQGKPYAPKPKPVPRPGKEPKKIGNGALPIAELNKWIRDKEASSDG